NVLQPSMGTARLNQASAAATAASTSNAMIHSTLLMVLQASRSAVRFPRHLELIIPAVCVGRHALSHCSPCGMAGEVAEPHVRIRAATESRASLTSHAPGEVLPSQVILPRRLPPLFYETRDNKHGLRHDPFKALAVPRPIGWISTLDKNGVCNLAP